MHLKHALIRKTAEKDWADILSKPFTGPIAQYHEEMGDRYATLGGMSAGTAAAGSAGAGLVGAGIGGTLGTALVWLAAKNPTFKDYLLGASLGAGIVGAPASVLGAAAGAPLPNLAMAGEHFNKAQELRR